MNKIEENYLKKCQKAQQKRFGGNKTVTDQLLKWQKPKHCTEIVKAWRRGFTSAVKEEKDECTISSIFFLLHSTAESSDGDGKDLFLPHIVFLSCFVIIFFVSLGCIFFLRPLCFIQLLLRFMCFCSCFSYNFRCFLKQFDLLGPPYKAIAWKSYKKQIFLYVYLQ